MSRYVFTLVTAIGILALGALTGCGQGSINGPVTVAAGQKSGDVSTVNGAVTVEDGATVGSAMTVNGSVTLGAKVTASSVKTVNGSVKIGDTTRVSGDVTTVNGSVMLDPHADVTGKVTDVNGAIGLKSARIGNGIETVNADIDIGEGSHVEGGIHVDKANLSGNSQKIPRIVIGPNAVVNGTLRFEHEVKLYVSDSAQVSGPIEGAEAEKFSGSEPPG